MSEVLLNTKKAEYAAMFIASMLSNPDDCHRQTVRDIHLRTHKPHSKIYAELGLAQANALLQELHLECSR